MSMTVTKRKDTQLPKCFQHKVADIRGGVSVKASELGGDILREGAVLSAPDNGITHVVKIARVVTKVTATEVEIRVQKFHNFAKGDFVMLGEGGKAYGITAIDDTQKNFDVITISETLGAIEEGGFLVEAKAASEDASELKYIPQSVAGTSKQFQAKGNLDVDAWVMAVTAGNPLPECVKKHLPCIINL